MHPTVIRPQPSYRTKLYLIAFLLAVLTILCTVPLGYVIGREGGEPVGATTWLVLTIAANALWIVPTFLLIHPYYKSLRYEIHEDEVIVRAGVITKSVKHVPYRTVTNLKVARGPFDRLLGIGTVDVQTAGMSGQQGAEEHLVGLREYQETYEEIARSLRRFRGGLPPTQAGEELVAGADPTAGALLAEVRAIRQGVEQLQAQRQEE